MIELEDRKSNHSLRVSFLSADSESDDTLSLFSKVEVRIRILSFHSLQFLGQRFLRFVCSCTHTFHFVLLVH